MLTAKSPAFYTGSFISNVAPNTPYLSLPELTAAMQTYCSREQFDAAKCAEVAQHYGERVGVPVAASGAAPTSAGMSSHPLASVSTPTLAAAMYALSTR